MKYLNTILPFSKKRIFKENLRVFFNFINPISAINLKTGKDSLHLFDSQYELNPADGTVTDFFDINFEDNYTFDSTQIKYRLSTPNTP